MLPRLYSNGIRIDFAYVDSTKVFDILMMDLYYLIKMLKRGGMVILDDVDYPGIWLIARFLVTHPSIKFLKGFNKIDVTMKQRVLGWFQHILFIKKLHYDSIYTNKLVDEKLGINYKCIAFKKNAEDKRNWNWFKSF
ncbi:hypothetical protein MASR2M41_17650 [Flammeovirgaceae bacterium]